MTTPTTPPPSTAGRGRALTLVIIVILAVGALAYSTMRKPPTTTEPAASTTPTTATIAPGPTNPTANTPTKPTPTPSSTALAARENATTADGVADAFAHRLASGLNGRAWAEDLRALVDWPMYQSLVHASAESVPATAVAAVVRTSDSRNVDFEYEARDEAGEVQFTFGVSTFTLNYAPAPLVTWVTVPEMGPVVDADGYPIAPPPAPLSQDGQQALIAAAIGAQKDLIEYNAGVDSPQWRTERLRSTLGGNEPPPLVATDVPAGALVRAVPPSDVYFLENLDIPDAVPDGRIAIGMTSSWIDAREDSPEPLGQVTLVVQLEWRNDMWAPAAIDYVNLD